MPCTDEKKHFPELLLQYSEQGLDPITRNEVRIHLEQCGYCQARMEEILQFMDILHHVDKRVRGDKSACLSPEELVSLADSPKTFPPDRLPAVKAHLVECMACNELFKKLLNLNKQSLQRSFETEREMPAPMKSRLARMVGERVKTGAATGGKVSIVFDAAAKSAAARDVAEISGRAVPPDQDRVPLLENQVSGTALDSSGAPVPREWIVLERNGADVYKVRTNLLGRFTFKNLHQGFYELQCRRGRALVIFGKGKRP
jgi:anti-sigma factor RsiW